MKSVIRISVSLLIVLLVSAGTALAAPQVELSVTVEKEVAEVNAKGETITRRIEAVDASQGEQLFYTIRFRNAGTEVATNVQLDNPIADGTTYKADTAWGAGADILFSIDRGKSFKKAAEMTYQVTERDGRIEQRRVEPEKYSAIRWVIERIQPGAGGEAGFTVQVN